MRRSPTRHLYGIAGFDVINVNFCRTGNRYATRASVRQPLLSDADGGNTHRFPTN